MRNTILMLSVLAAMPAVAAAQYASDPVSSSTFTRTFEIRPFAGVFVPTGSQRDVLDDAGFTGLQLGFEVHPNVTLVGSFGWAPSEDVTRSSANKVDIYQYDVGAELGTTRQLGSVWSIRPFVGLGAGARTYSYRDLELDTQTNFAGYGALGTEFRVGRMAIRIEGRDYVSAFEGLDGLERSSTRNDLSFAAGITYHFR